MINTYYEKYVEYKLKYISLQKQLKYDKVMNIIGGGNELNIELPQQQYQSDSIEEIINKIKLNHNTEFGTDNHRKINPNFYIKYDEFINKHKNNPSSFGRHVDDKQYIIKFKCYNIRSYFIIYCNENVANEKTVYISLYFPYKNTTINNNSAHFAPMDFLIINDNNSIYCDDSHLNTELYDFPEKIIIHLIDGTINMITGVGIPIMIRHLMLCYLGVNHANIYDASHKTCSSEKSADISISLPTYRNITCKKSIYSKFGYTNEIMASEISNYYCNIILDNFLQQLQPLIDLYNILKYDSGLSNDIRKTNTITIEPKYKKIIISTETEKFKKNFVDFYKYLETLMIAVTELKQDDEKDIDLNIGLKTRIENIYNNGTIYENCQKYDKIAPLFTKNFYQLNFLIKIDEKEINYISPIKKTLDSYLRNTDIYTTTKNFINNINLDNLYRK